MMFKYIILFGKKVRKLLVDLIRVFIMKVINERFMFLFFFNVLYWIEVWNFYKEIK